MADQPQVTWMTQESYDRLQAEHTELSTNGRLEIAKRIEVARGRHVRSPPWPTSLRSPG